MEREGNRKKKRERDGERDKAKCKKMVLFDVSGKQIMLKLSNFFSFPLNVFDVC